MGRDHGVLTTVWGRESDSASRWLHVHLDVRTERRVGRTGAEGARGTRMGLCPLGGERQRAESGSSPPLGIRPEHVPKDIRAGVKRRDSKGSACNKAGGSLSPLPSTSCGHCGVGVRDQRCQGPGWARGGAAPAASPRLPPWRVLPPRPQCETLQQGHRSRAQDQDHRRSRLSPFVTCQRPVMVTNKLLPDFPLGKDTHSGKRPLAPQSITSCQPSGRNFISRL